MIAYKYKVLSILGPFILALDQLTKFLVLKNIAIGKLVPIIPGYLDLVHVRNTGAAFGMLSTWDESFRTPFFYGISILAIVILFCVFRQLEAHNRFYAYVLSFIYGGVLGNLIDRIRFGNVVDFLSLHIQDKVLWGVKLDWPAFNVADSAITVAMVLLVSHMLKKRGKIKEKR